MESGGTGTARKTLTVSAWTLVSRLTGLMRVVAIGAVLGPTFFANTFLAANSVPNLTYTAMAGPVMALVLVPALVKSLSGAGLEASGMLLARVAGYLLTVATAVAAALALVSPLVAFAVTAGIPDSETREHLWKLTVVVLLFVAPQLICYTVAGIGEAVQQARGRFALAAAAPAVESVGLILTMVLVEIRFDPGRDMLDVSLTMALVLGIGSTLSVALHAAVQVFGCRRAGLPIRVRRGWRSDPATSEVTHRLRRSVMVAALPAVSMFGMLAIAATVPGGVFVFQAGLSVYFVIAALGPRAVTAVAMPGMSAAVDDRPRFGAAWRQALTFAATASLPAGVLLAAFAEPVATTLASGELNDTRTTEWLAACLVVFALAQFANALNQIGRQTLFARLDVRTPRVISTVTLVVRLAVGLASLLLPVGGYRLVGLCVAVLVAEVMAATVGLWRIHRAIRPERLLDLRALRSVALATAAMAPVAAFGSWLVQDRVDDRVAQLVVGLGLGGLAAACFVLALALLTGQLATAKAWTVKARSRLTSRR